MKQGRKSELINVAVVAVMLLLTCVFGQDLTCDEESADWRPVDDPAADLVPIAARDRPFDLCSAGRPKCIEPNVSLFEFARTKHARPPEHVFVAVNGESEGCVFEFRLKGCLRSLGAAALELLAAPNVERRGPKYLYSSSGFPIRNGAEVETRAGRELYVLNSRQTWVWPAHAINFTFPVHGNISLRTASVHPRVFVVNHLLSATECDAIVATYDKELVPSPEKHYSDEFKDHRTSETGWMRDHPLRQSIYRVLRLPIPALVESLQFLKYLPGKHYKFHHDYFHDYRPNHLQMLRRWLRMRIIELVEVDETVAPPVQTALREKVIRRPHEEWSPRDPARTPLLNWIMRLARPTLPAESLVDAKRELNVPSEQKLAELLVVKRSGSFKHAGLVAVSSLFARILARETAQESALKVFLGSLVYGTLTNESRIDTEPLESEVQPNRHATVLPYLSDVEEGGETALPDSEHPEAFLGEGFVYPKHPGLPECSKGLILAPKKGAASLFYHRLPSGDLDVRSVHAGCPPTRGVKYAINGFTWNVPPDFGLRFFFD